MLISSAAKYFKLSWSKPLPSGDSRKHCYCSVVLLTVWPWNHQFFSLHVYTSSSKNKIGGFLQFTMLLYPNIHPSRLSAFCNFSFFLKSKNLSNLFTVLSLKVQIACIVLRNRLHLFFFSPFLFYCIWSNLVVVICGEPSSFKRTLNWTLAFEFLMAALLQLSP